MISKKSVRMLKRFYVKFLIQAGLAGFFKTFLQQKKPTNLAGFLIYFLLIIFCHQIFLARTKRCLKSLGTVTMHP